MLTWLHISRISHAASPAQVVHILRGMAHTQGRTIVCTIHQPSSEVRVWAWRHL